MDKNEKVVYLTDYIEENRNVEVLSKHHTPLNLTKPNDHLAKRVIAFGVDLMAIGVVKTATHSAYAIAVNEFLGPINYSQRNQLINGSMPLHVVTFVAIYWAYFLYTTYVLGGKTLGKMTMGLRVIDENFIQNHEQLEYQLDLGSSIKRALGYVLCYMSFGTFFIFNFSSEDKRGLPDYLSSSRTVSDSWLEQMLAHKQNDIEQLSIDIKSLDVTKAA